MTHTRNGIIAFLLGAAALGGCAYAIEGERLTAAAFEVCQGEPAEDRAACRDRVLREERAALAASDACRAEAAAAADRQRSVLLALGASREDAGIGNRDSGLRWPARAVPTQANGHCEL